MYDNKGSHSSKRNYKSLAKQKAIQRDRGNPHRICGFSIFHMQLIYMRGMNMFYSDINTRNGIKLRLHYANYFSCFSSLFEKMHDFLSTHLTVEKDNDEVFLQ